MRFDAGVVIAPCALMLAGLQRSGNGTTTRTPDVAADAIA